MTDDQWHSTIRNELDLVFYACSAAWPHFVAGGGGSIVNVGSTCSVSAVPRLRGAWRMRRRRAPSLRSPES